MVFTQVSRVCGKRFCTNPIGCLSVAMWLTGAGMINSVVISVVLSRWGSLGNGQVCQLDCKLRFITGASGDELSVIGAVVSGMFAGRSV